MKFNIFERSRLIQMVDHINLPPPSRELVERVKGLHWTRRDIDELRTLALCYGVAQVWMF